MGDGGCSDVRSHHCTPTWATRVKLSQKKKKQKQKNLFTALSRIFSNETCYLFPAEGVGVKYVRMIASMVCYH